MMSDKRFMQIPGLHPHHQCVRCGHICKHVEMVGIYYCPNCGEGEDAGNGMQYLHFWNGCQKCGVEGVGYRGVKAVMM